MKKIPLGNGKFALVDDKDFKDLSQFKWHVGAGGYVMRNISKKVKRGACEYMHRRILKTPSGKYADHRHPDRPGNRLDNRRSNLRNCTPSQNHYNSRLRSDSTTKLKGVSKKNDYPRSKPFIAQIQFNKTHKFLGHFKTAEQAHKAYKEAAKKHHGEFARYE